MLLNGSWLINMPRRIKCRLCNTVSPSTEFKGRMKWLRRHYKRKHPKAWGKAIKKAIKTKKEEKIFSYDKKVK